MKCDDIQGVLFDYMARELGAARSDLVRAHLRKCEACRAAAAEIQGTLSILQAVRDAEEPMRLTQDRRKRLRRAIMHPVLDWILVHHVAVSLAVAVLALAAAAACLRLYVWQPRPPESIPVLIRPGSPDEPPPPLDPREPIGDITQ